MDSNLISPTQNTAQYNKIFNILLFFITVLFFLTRHYYFSFLIIFSCLFLTTHVFNLLDFYIYVLPSSLFITSMPSTSTSAAVPFLKFWVSNFSIQFFFSCTGTFVHFFSFHFFFPFDVFWFTECKFVLVLRTIFFF